MNQQVNLYQPVFRKQQKVFSAATMVKIMVVLVIGFGAIYGFGRFQLAKLETQVTALEQQRDNASVQLTRVSEQRQPARRSGLLEDQLRQAHEALEQKQRAITALQQREGSNIAGFSEYFAGLGRQRLDGLWLTRIAIHAGGEVRLHGNAELAQLVPRYLQRLGEEQAFQGTEFSSIHIQRTQAPALNAFRVSTTRRDES